MASKRLTPLGHEYYNEDEMLNGVWLNPPIGANFVIFAAIGNYLHWRDDGALPFPGHKLSATKHIEYHGSKLNHVTLRGTGAAAVSFYRM